MVEYFLCVIDNYFKIKGFGMSMDYIQCLWMYIGSYEEVVGIFQFVDVFCYCYCFGGSGGFVQKRSRGYIQFS